MCWLAALPVAGCSTWVDVRPLATSRADVEAYELRGPELAVLRREVLRRCPQGAEVLRQAAGDQQTAADQDGRIARWLNRASAWVDPPNREAQMLVVCKPGPQGLSLALAKLADEAAPSERTGLAATTDTDSAVLPSGPNGPSGPSGPNGPNGPIGPITPEW